MASKPPLKPKSSTIAALDIGSSKIACLIARVDAGGEVTITGIGHQLSKGVRGSVITDISEAETSIVAAVHAAEQMAGETLEHVVVNLSASQLLSRQVTVEMGIAGDGVTEQDIADILYEGQASVRNEEQEIIHCFPVNYTLDDNKNIRDPRQMVGEVLGTDLHLVTAPASLVRNIALCVGRCHLHLDEFVVASHASALAVLEPDEMQLGVTVIDMGGGTTTFSVFSQGKNVYSDVVPIGGIHVTNDIAKGLSTALPHAERLKTLHGSAVATTQDEQVMIDVPQLGEDYDADDGNQMPRSMLVGIIRPRLEEIFEMIRGKIEASGVERVAGRRVVLTGGASQLIGTRELASRILGKQVRMGRPPVLPGLADAVSGPAFATVVGMLDYIIDRPMEESFLHARRSGRGFLARMERLVRWVKENF